MDNLNLPKGFIVFISGVPGSGKTTLSYNLLKKYGEFRIVEETDLIREVLLGYNEYLVNEYTADNNFIREINITNHNKLLSLNEAKEQCNHMKYSLKKIIERQQRKGICTIINGVHIIPGMLNELIKNNNIIYINLFVNNQTELYNRIYNRDSSSYMLEHIPFIYQTNLDLYQHTCVLCKSFPYLFYNIDVTNLTIDKTLEKIIFCINEKLQNINNS